MHDLMPEKMLRHNVIKKIAYDIAFSHGFKQISTPIIEYADMFTQLLGSTTDVVHKEMYLFNDKKNRTLALRPENTAPIVRAFHNDKQSSLPSKFFYSGPMFRYERPQSGRYRQFTQFGVEIIGEKLYSGDIDGMLCAWHIVQNLKLEKICSLSINSLGNSETREKYRSVIIEFLSDDKDKLSENSQKLLNTNPLRILDSKNKEDQCLINYNLPHIFDSMDAESKDRFEYICGILICLGVPFKKDWKLVRGLDYYNDTVFEIIANKNTPEQHTLFAGGRYDNLVSKITGKDIGGFGWAAGVERLCHHSPSFYSFPPPDIAIVYGKHEGDKLDAEFISWTLKSKNYRTVVLPFYKYEKRKKEFPLVANLNKNKMTINNGGKSYQLSYNSEKFLQKNGWYYDNNMNDNNCIINELIAEIKNC